ncbi:MAG: hypothetical protein GXP19_00640 [Gammaproteobacteria bacterium]|nr:hypothetical protein [Gammaproteobacteria bacterium]
MQNNLLTYPEIQSGFMPFVIALVIGVVFKSNKFALAGVGVALGFIATALLLNGFVFSPLNGTRKIVLVGIMALIIAGVFQLNLSSWRYRRVTLVFFAVLAFLWVTWPVLMRIEGINKWAIAMGCSAYMLWHIVSLDSFKDKPLQASSSVFALGFGTGISAIFGASALYGQLSVSMGAAAGALLLCLLLFSELKTGVFLTYPAGVLLGLLGIATLLFADLTWIALVFLALIPLTARIPLPDGYSRWQRMIILNLAVMLPTAIAILSAWYLADASPY